MDLERRQFILAGTATAALSGCTGILATAASLEFNAVNHASTTEHDTRLNIDASIENTGDETGTDTIVVSIGGNVVDGQEITVDGGETTTVSFQIPSDQYDPGTHSLTVSTDDDTHESDITVTKPEPASLSINRFDTPLLTPHNQPIQVTVTVRNTGDVTAEQDITIRNDGSTLVTEPVTVAGGDTTEVELSIPTDEFFSGEYTLTARTADDETTASVTVENPNPYDKQTLTVGLEQQTPARHDIREVVTDALAYWEQNAEQYAGYPIEYEYRANASDPDVKIVVVEQILNCGDHNGEAAGCAPLVRSSAPNTARIRIVDGYRQKWMTTTLKHELGHTLGLGHNAEPAHIMSNEIEDRIPNYADRQEAIDAYLDSFTPFSSGNTTWDAAQTAWSNRNYERAETKADEAADHLMEAQRHIDTARGIAQQLGEDTAYDLLQESYNKAKELRLAASAAVSMAQEAQKTYGDPEPYRKESNEHIQNYNEYNFHDSGAISRGFGFPTRS